MQWALPRDPFWQERESTLFGDGDREGVRWWGVTSHPKISREEDPERIYVAWSVSSSSHKHLPLPPTPAPRYPRDLPRKEPEPLKD